jgi:hypothetical protein
MTMNIKTVLWCALAVLCTQTGLAWGGPIYNTVKMQPLNLITPLGNITPKSLFVTNIACIDASNGQYTDCAFDIRINGLVQPNTEVANNGGHLPNMHSGTRPVGDLQIIFPTIGAKTQFVYGQTNYSYVNVVYEMPEVSGKIETVLNLRVPPGWHTVYPESCDISRTYWCFNTMVDVGVVTDLLPLADPQTYPRLPYIRVRNNPTTDPHPNSVAFYGTINTLFFLNNIAISYQKKGYMLSVNDMSLPRGGLFDVHANYLTPHGYHRTGQSVDINKNFGDCLKNKMLRLVVDAEMPIQAGSKFANPKRYFPSRFLCETGNNNNIHLDFDGMVF